MYNKMKNPVLIIFSLFILLLAAKEIHGNNTIENKTYWIKVGNYKDRDSVSFSQFAAIDSIRALDKTFSVVSYSAIYIPQKGTKQVFESQNYSLSYLQGFINRTAKPGDRILFAIILLKNAKNEKQMGKEVLLIFI